MKGSARAWRRLFSLAFLMALGCHAVSDEPGPGILPVEIEVNHASSFGWFAQHADLDRPHTLLLIDAHSDASAVNHSDALREGIRRVASEEERAQRIAVWQRRARVQAYNWIEPLMPEPVSKVVWVARWKSSAEEKLQRQREAGESVDGRIEFEARKAGELADRWQVLDGEALAGWSPEGQPVLASIDLDFFAGSSPTEAVERFRVIWARLLDLPELKAVSIAISRPWLKDDAEAFRLLSMVLEEVRLVPGARVSFEPFIPAGPDDSLRAQELAAEGSLVPSFRIEEAPSAVRAGLALRGSSLRVQYEAERWSDLLRKWKQEVGTWEVRADEGQLSLDGILRLPEACQTALRVRGEKRNGTGKVRWFSLRPAAACYHLLPDLELGKSFARGAGPWVREVRVPLAETQDGALAAEAWRKALDAGTGWGRVRIEAEVETADGWMPTPVLELRVSSGEGFRAGLSEQFGSPYVFGAGLYREGDRDGPEACLGNDCANFLVQAWRRTGRELPWCSPGQLRGHLRALAEKCDLNSRVAMTPDKIDRGVAIDFGNHMAALWEDREPRGVLDAGDLVVHQLGGVPERTTLGALAATRPRFAVRTLPESPVVRVLIGGDVVLAGVERAAVEALRERVQAADLAVVNLEGVPGRTPEHPIGRYQFTFPPERLSWLKAAGIVAVGMANNHAGDAGGEGVAPALGAISKAGLGVFGFGVEANSAVKPWLVECRGVRLAFFAAACVESMEAGASKGGVAALPRHAAELERALAEARDDGRTVIVLTHWGGEYTEEVDDEQRHWARWLIEHGADLVAGAHPHVVQPMDTWRGRPVAFSLGNTVFPTTLQGSDSGAWLEVNIGANGEILSTHLEGIERKKRQGN